MSSGAGHRFAAIEGEHWWYRGRRKVYLAHLRSAVGAVQVARALDVGGGTGGFEHGLARVAERVVGLDHDLDELSRARRRGTRECIAGDARALPFADRAFDLVTLFDVLEHVDDEERALSEARRVLRPGGLLVLSVPAYDWLHAHGGEARAPRRYTRARIRRALEGADLTVERITHANVVLFPLIAPTVLLFELLQRLRIVPTAARSVNLALPTPGWLSALLYRAFTSELSLSGRFDLPFGHSIVAIARRPVPARTKRVKRKLRVRVAALPSPVEPAAPLPARPAAAPRAEEAAEAPLPGRSGTAEERAP